MSQVTDCRGLDQQALAGLNHRFRGPLNAYFRRRLRSVGEAEDFTQEVFLRLAKHQNSLSPHNVEALVFTIAANLLRDRGRRDAVRGAPPMSVEQDESVAGDVSLVEALHPERVVLARDDLNRALAALAELGERTRDVFVLQRLEGLKNKEVAKELGISVSAVEKHMVKALVHISSRVSN